jgi:hypothetical protein
VGAVILTLGGACGGNSSPTTQGSMCTPGQSIACAGPGCAGYQVCNVRGSYDACTCPTDAAAGVDSGSNANEAAADGPEESAAPDSSVSAGDAGDASAWTPKELPGLALWLDGTVGIVPAMTNAAQVVRWLDQSGNGNDATGECTNAGCSGSFPTLEPARVNGLDAVTCGAMSGGNGTAFTIAGSSSLQFGTGEWAIALVARTSPTAAVTLWSQGGLSSIESDPSTLTLQDATAHVSAAQNAGTFQWLVAMERGGTLWLVTPSGSWTGPLGTGDLPGAVTLCGNQNLNAGYAEFAEVVAIKGFLTDADVFNLGAYFNRKFAL